MRLVVGLGNPGPKYADTRHNFGFLCLEELSRRYQDGAKGTLLEQASRPGLARWQKWRHDQLESCLLWPLTYMNLSGQAIGYLAAHFGVPFARSEILVVVDDLSLPLGQTRLRKKGSSGGHNGLKSIEAYLCSTEYARLRLGIGQPEPGGEVIDYVLSPFASFEQQTVSQVIAFSAQAAEDWCRRVSFESLVGKVNGWRPQGNRNDGEEV